MKLVAMRVESRDGIPVEVANLLNLGQHFRGVWVIDRSDWMWRTRHRRLCDQKVHALPVWNSR